MFFDNRGIELFPGFSLNLYEQPTPAFNREGFYSVKELTTGAEIQDYNFFFKTTYVDDELQHFDAAVLRSSIKQVIEKAFSEIGQVVEVYSIKIPSLDQLIGR